MRRRLATSLVGLAALTASACATASAVTPAVRDRPRKLSGVYRTRVDSEFHSGALNGLWRLHLDHGGYTFNYTGKSSKKVIVMGTYVINGHDVTFRDRSEACSAKPGSGGCRYFGCRKAAKYSFKASGSKLDFRKVRDPNTNCELPVVLLSGEFHRVD